MRPPWTLLALIALGLLTATEFMLGDSPSGGAWVAVVAGLIRLSNPAPIEENHADGAKKPRI